MSQGPPQAGYFRGYSPRARLPSRSPSGQPLRSVQRDGVEGLVARLDSFGTKGVGSGVQRVGVASTASLAATYRGLCDSRSPFFLAAVVALPRAGLGSLRRGRR